MTNHETGPPHSVYDLHTHSTASDGILSPEDLITRAHQQGVKVIALTDHDTVSGIDEALNAAKTLGIQLIPGIEVSVTWEKKLLHILGLGIDPENNTLKENLKALQETRMARAVEIGRQLEKHGISVSYQEAKELAGTGMITRTHFARCLINKGYAADMPGVFDRFLASGKPGYVNVQWAELGAAVEWIRNAGGIAVLAHPFRYKLTASWLKKALTAFKSAGGLGIEIVTGHNNRDEISRAAEYARLFDLCGSVGSDFHDPGFKWIELGRLQALPSAVTPVWQQWEQTGLSAIRS